MLKALAILFALFGMYSLYVVVSGHGYLYAVGTVVTLAAAFGLWFRKPWSQYVVYFFSAAYVIQWLWLLWHAVQNNQWPNAGVSKSIIALFPGMLLVALVLSLSIVAYRGFRVRS